MSDINSFISSDRSDFTKGELNQQSLEENPFKLFNKWFKDALDKMAMEPYAFHLATSVDNKPTSRVVYMRTIEENGFVFFTNYKGRKGKEIEANHNVSMNFFWAELERQVRIEGVVEKIPTKASDAYFESRPRKSQIGAWASNQSDTIEDYKTLEERVLHFEAKFKDKAVPRPPHWGGYIIKPTYFEFWQGRQNRLHDRFAFSLKSDNWDIKRLNP